MTTGIGLAVLLSLLVALVGFGIYGLATRKQKNSGTCKRITLPRFLAGSPLAAAMRQGTPKSADSARAAAKHYVNTVI
jgi:hypothetical protein